MVVSEWACGFSAMAPPAWKEWTPTELGSMPLSCSVRSLTAWQIVEIIISGVTYLTPVICLNMRRSSSSAPVTWIM
eukprot:1884325-Ditylum_brightwellii.AAC.1